MSDDLNSFLNGAAAENTQPDALEELIGVPMETTRQRRDAKPDPAAPEAEAPAPDAPEPDGDHDDEPEEETGIRKALAAERDKRRDWKEKAIRAEGEMAELRRQLEAARQPPQQPQEQRQPPPPVDPSVDPQGFVARVQEVMLNERLNTSEMMLRRELGTEKVDAAIAEFKEAMKENPGLQQQLYGQPHPYEWMHKQVEIRRLQRDIGTDPDAYRAKIEAELRAKWEAERGEQPLTVPARSPAAGLPPSLATARNAVPRGTSAFNGPPPLEDVFGR